MDGRRQDRVVIKIRRGNGGVGREGGGGGGGRGRRRKEGGFKIPPFFSPPYHTFFFSPSRNVQAGNGHCNFFFRTFPEMSFAEMKTKLENSCATADLNFSLPREMSKMRGEVKKKLNLFFSFW